MEGIAFSRDTAVIMTGVFVSQEEVVAVDVGDAAADLGCDDD